MLPEILYLWVSPPQKPISPSTTHHPQYEMFPTLTNEWPIRQKKPLRTISCCCFFNQYYNILKLSYIFKLLYYINLVKEILIINFANEGHFQEARK